jgi:glycosyltransferase involved in cell wall biosynthesis
LILEKRSIVIFISDLKSGGAQRVACSLARYWAHKGFTVTIVTLSNVSGDFFPIPKTVYRQTIGLDKKSSSFAAGFIVNIRRIYRLRRILAQLKPDVTIGFIAPSAALVVAAAIGTPTRTIAAERNDPRLQSFGRTWDFLRYLAYRYADRVTVNSHGALTTIAEKIPSSNIIFTPNPIPIPLATPAITLDGPTILTVSRLHQQKGIDLLLAAFAALRAPDWHLMVVGEGREREKLEQYSRTLGVQTRTTFVGIVDNPMPYYKAADIFALPSRHEGTPNALLEAMSVGLPAVVSDASSGPRDLVEGPNTGFVVKTGDINSLTQALQQLIDDPQLRHGLGERAAAFMNRERRNDKAYKLWDTAITFSNCEVSGHT